MRSTSFAIAMLSIISTSASADETLKWRHVQHTASLQTMQVGDVNGHTLNIYRLPGIAFFSDGTTGGFQAFGASDTINGSGPVNGYIVLTLNDGSEIWARYAGEVKVEGNRVPRKGTFSVIGGKGRYAGAKGDGTWEGDGALVTAGTDAVSYVDGVLNIKK
jgi:hypothetical protein